MIQHFNNTLVQKHEMGGKERVTPMQFIPQIRNVMIKKREREREKHNKSPIQKAIEEQQQGNE